MQFNLRLITWRQTTIHRGQFIGHALARDPEAIVNTSIELLELLANALIGIIGEQGFETLLFRSVHRVNLAASRG